MSWLYSAALAAEYSAATYSASELSAQSNITNTPQAYLHSARMMVAFQLSRYGMTFAHLTASRGEDVLASFLAAFPASDSAAQRLDATTLMTFGRRCGASWQMSLPGTYSPRTSSPSQSKKRQRTAGLWVTKPEHFPLARQTWVATTFGSDIGYLHTPTTKANYAAASMQKWPAARAFVQAFGRPTPTNQEWLMGYPAGWTDTAPLAMDKFQSWRQQHFTHSHSATEEAA